MLLKKHLKKNHWSRHCFCPPFLPHRSGLIVVDFFFFFWLLEIYLFFGFGESMVGVICGFQWWWVRLSSSVDGGRLGVVFGGLVAWVICGFQGWWVVGLVDGF